MGSLKLQCYSAAPSQACSFIWRCTAPRSPAVRLCQTPRRKQSSRHCCPRRSCCCCSMQPSAAATQQAAAPAPPAASTHKTLLCTSITASTVEGALAELAEAAEAGATAVELRLDYLQEFDAQTDLPRLLQASTLPVIVTMRPKWEGGLYDGPEPERLAVLKFAAVLGAAFIDVEFKVAQLFFAAGELPIGTKIILSYHDYKGTPDVQALAGLIDDMVAAGADIAKIATTANSIADCAQIFTLLVQAKAPCIALAMGERGQLTRLLAPKYGGYLTFGALRAGSESAPGQPTLAQMVHLYRLPQQTKATEVFGIIGNPVAHSRSPVLHNPAFAAAGVDAVYVPLLVEDLRGFLQLFSARDFGGFSVTIPHKVEAMRNVTSIDTVAESIGAVNTLVRQPDGSLRGYNTDWTAAIAAIEDALRRRQPGANARGPQTDAAPQHEPSPLQGKTVAVVGAGGAGRALVFGAAKRGARVLLANRSRQKAEDLASAAAGRAEVVDLAELLDGRIHADVLANTTSLGMHPHEGESPMGGADLSSFELVFDAVYTPVNTKLLQDAQAAGCTTVSGLEMFIGQAVQQFELFTGKPAPEDLMRRAVLESMNITL